MRASFRIQWSCHESQANTFNRTLISLLWKFEFCALYVLHDDKMYKNKNKMSFSLSGFVIKLKWFAFSLYHCNWWFRSLTNLNNKILIILLFENVSEERTQNSQNFLVIRTKYKENKFSIEKRFILMLKMRLCSVTIETPLQLNFNLAFFVSHVRFGGWCLVLVSVQVRIYFHYQFRH